MIKNFEETLESNGLATETLNTKTGEVHLEMKSTENDIRRLIIVQENLTSEKDAIQFVNQKLNSKVIELKKVQESVMAQHARECSLARERIHELECEAEGQVSNEIETEKKDQLRKISALETKSKDNTEKLHAEIWKKAEQIDGLLKQGETDEQHVELMDKQVRHLYKTLEEKEQLTPQYKEQEKNLEEQITEIPDHLVAKIISRVPSKNIQRCHILSHEFNNSHLQGPFFLQSQLDLKKNCKDIWITAWRFGLPSVDNFSSIRAPFQQHFYGIHLDKPEEMPTRYQCSHLLTLPVSPTFHYEISGSVHGLICLQRSSSLATEPNCLIYNPGSKIVTVIPASVSSLSEVGVQVDLGYYLGFNASSSTYKVLNIEWLWGASNTLTGVLFRIFEFGDATNDVIPRWKAIEVNLETLPFDFIGCSQHFKLQKSILVGSTLHWMIRDLGIIPTFSLNDEAFQGVINLPPGPPPIYGDIFDFDGSIGFISIEESHFELCVLKDNEWVRQMTFSHESLIDLIDLEFFPLGSFGSGQLALYSRSNVDSRYVKAILAGSSQTTSLMFRPPIGDFEVRGSFYEDVQHAPFPSLGCSEKLSTGQNNFGAAAPPDTPPQDKLAMLFSLHTSLVHYGSFEEAQTAALVQDKWILVNVQSDHIFTSYMLNRDTWANDTVIEVLNTYFIFWQVHDHTAKGMNFCMTYLVEPRPAIVLVDPINGLKKRSWHGMVQPNALLESLLPFLESSPSQTTKYTSPQGPFEEVKLLAKENRVLDERSLKQCREEINNSGSDGKCTNSASAKSNKGKLNSRMTSSNRIQRNIVFSDQESTRQPLSPLDCSSL